MISHQNQWFLKRNRAHKGNSLKQKNLLKSLTTMNCPPSVKSDHKFRRTFTNLYGSFIRTDQYVNTLAVWTSRYHYQASHSTLMQFMSLMCLKGDAIAMTWQIYYLDSCRKFIRCHLQHKCGDRKKLKLKFWVVMSVSTNPIMKPFLIPGWSSSHFPSLCLFLRHTALQFLHYF